MNRNMTLLRSLCIAALALPLIAVGQESKQSPGPNRIVIKPDGLPEPFKSPSVQNQPRVVPQPAGAKPDTQHGFDLSVFSEDGYLNPRWIIEGPNGDLFLTDSAQQSNSIFLLRDANKDGKIDNATERFTFVTGLNRPFGMAIQKVGAQTYFYVGNTDSVVRFKYQVGQTKLEGPPEKLIELPIGGHWTRDVLFRRGGKKKYGAVGAGAHVHEGEPPIRAAINEYNPDGT